MRRLARARKGNRARDAIVAALAERSKAAYFGKKGHGIFGIVQGGDFERYALNPPKRSRP